MSTADFWVGPFTDPDRYRLVSLLGGGGEGEVWDAVLPLSAEGRSTVAIKVLAARDGDESEFERSGRLMRMLNHPGLVRVTENFTGPLMHRGGLADISTRANYVVMDLVEGTTLREWCDEHPDASAAARLKMLRTVASALDEMHSGAATHVPVAHGDVKPANVVVKPDGGTVLVDLGLARLADGIGVTGRSAPYAAPELRGARPVASPEADRFAFAVTTAQVLTGVPVPTGPDGWLDTAALADQLYRSPVTARRPVLVQHVLDALAAPPDARPRGLRLWLDSAAETLSQVTTGGELGWSAAVSSGGAGVVAEQTARTAVLDPPVTPAEPGLRRRSRFPLIAGLAVVLVIAGVVGAALLTSRDPDLGGTPDATTVAAPPPSGTPTAEPTATSGRSTSDAYLSDLRPVERGRSGSGWAEPGVATVSGTRYAHAVMQRAYCTSRDGGDTWADYDLSRSWSRFTTVVGLDDTSRASASVTYKVLADQAVVASGALTLGQSVPIDVSVAGALRVRLQINDPSATRPTCGTRTDAQVAWGDATLVP